MFVFKLEADGYAPFVSRTMTVAESPVTMDVALRPSQDTVVSLVMPDGKPAANTEVVLLEAGGSVHLIGEGFNPVNLENGVRLLTGYQGKFRLPEGTISTRAPLKCAIHFTSTLANAGRPSRPCVRSSSQAYRFSRSQ